MDKGFAGRMNLFLPGRETLKNTILFRFVPIPGRKRYQPGF
jgi:hypothetical protein